MNDDSSVKTVGIMKDARHTYTTRNILAELSG